MLFRTNHGGPLSKPRNLRHCRTQMDKACCEMMPKMGGNHFDNEGQIQRSDTSRFVKFCLEDKCVHCKIKITPLPEHHAIHRKF
jgi:hypothetical protein